MEPSAENDWRMLDRVIPGGDVSISIGKRVEETKSESVASRYFEDLKVGERFSSEAYEVPGKAIIEFAEKFDPQMFHLNPKSAERSIFKGLVASGWHTAAMTMRLFVKTLDLVEGAIGLGVDELRWPNAVRPGDILRVETEILEARRSQSKPKHGVIRLRNITSNERGKIVQTMYAHALIPCREVESGS